MLFNLNPLKKLLIDKKDIYLSSPLQLLDRYIYTDLDSPTSLQVMLSLEVLFFIHHIGIQYLFLLTIRSTGSYFDFIKAPVFYWVTRFSTTNHLINHQLTPNDWVSVWIPDFQISSSSISFPVSLCLKFLILFYLDISISQCSKTVLFWVKSWPV